MNETGINCETATYDTDSKVKNSLQYSALRFVHLCHVSTTDTRPPVLFGLFLSEFIKQFLQHSYHKDIHTQALTRTQHIKHVIYMTILYYTSLS
jgi:hypothetical protein